RPDDAAAVSRSTEAPAPPHRPPAGDCARHHPTDAVSYRIHRPRIRQPGAPKENPLSTDMQAAYAELIARLTGPGGPHELAREDVLGAPMTVFKNRATSLAQLVDDSAKFGDTDYLVTDDQRITFAQHVRDVRSLAKVFAEEYGVGKGDRVAI